MKYVPTIGLEIHSILKTKTKMFCDSPNNLDEKHPNQNVCPVCLGHPGALPTINKDAVKSVLKLGLVIGGEISPITKFDRKNYFYPDLPKGYQISQYDQPLVSGGVMELKNSKTKIRLRRIHLEEDAGRLLHDTDNSKDDKKSKASLVDFNRAGVPLMELVTEADFKSGEEVLEFAKKLQLLLRYLGISDADMEKGQMRVEANISLGEWVRGNWKMGTKVEVKNINSFRAVQGAIDYEIKRQEEVLKKKGRIIQETRGWDPNKKITVSQRSKEEAHDYRYFPEPDLPPFETKVFELQKIKESLPELPEQKLERFMSEYNLSEALAIPLIEDLPLANFFEAAASELAQREKEEKEGETGIKKSAVLLYNYLTSDLKGLMNDMGIGFSELKITPEHLAHLTDLIADGKIMSRVAKDILKKMAETGLDPEEIMDSEGLHAVSDESELESAVKEIITDNPSAVADYKKGKAASVQFLIGKAMGKLKGRGNPETLRELFLKNLK